MRLLAAVPGAAGTRMSLQQRSSSVGAGTGDMRGCMENLCWELVFLDVSAEAADCSGLILKMQDNGETSYWVGSKEMTFWEAGMAYGVETEQNCG